MDVLYIKSIKDKSCLNLFDGLLFKYLRFYAVFISTLHSLLISLQKINKYSAIIAHLKFFGKFNIPIREVIMALDSAKTAAIVKEFARTENDTGSSEVQIALLSKRIAELTEHLKTHKKDHASRLGLLKLVGQRRRLMRYFKRKNKEGYNTLIAKLEIRDNV